VRNVVDPARVINIESTFLGSYESLLERLQYKSVRLFVCVIDAWALEGTAES
jgi:hypothetical protein